MQLHCQWLDRQRIRGFSSGPDRKDYIRAALEWMLISFAAAWLMYDSFLMFWFLLPGMYMWMKFRKETLQQRYKRKYAMQFGEGLTMLAASVSAGYSAESAVTEALKDLRLIHGKDNALMEEFEIMAGQISMNRNMEELFFEMADRSGLEDVISLADVFRAARRSGGNLPEILEDTAVLLEEKEAVAQEIEVLLAGKRYEQKIMCMIPFGMILYLRLGSPGYLDVLYHSPAGICIMTVCLAVYAAAVYMGSKVLNIEI